MIGFRFTTAVVTLILLYAGGVQSAAEEFINVRNPVSLPQRIAAERVPVGIPDDYKPCVTLLPDGELLLVMFYPVQEGGAYREDMILYRSADGGQTWGPRRVLPLLGREPYFSQLRDGTLFITTHLLTQDVRNKDGYDLSYVHRSTDRGQTWTTLRIDAEDVPGAAPKTWTHTSRNVLELKDGSLIMGVSAGSSIDYLWCSQDKGETWDKSLACKVEGFDVTKQGFPWHAETVFSRPATATSWGAPAVFPALPDSDIPEGNDHVERMTLFRSRDGGANWTLEPELGNYYAEMYQALLRLDDGRLLLTFTVRDLRPPLGVHAVLGQETEDSFVLDFDHDRLVLDEKTPPSQHSGGGFGGTVQLQDGTLVTAYTYRDGAGKTHAEVVRWRLP